MAPPSSSCHALPGGEQGIRRQKTGCRIARPVDRRERARHLGHTQKYAVVPVRQPARPEQRAGRDAIATHQFHHDRIDPKLRMNMLEQSSREGPVGGCHEIQDRLAGQARDTDTQNGLRGTRGGNDLAIVAHLDEQVRRGEGESDVAVPLEAQMPKRFGGCLARRHGRCGAAAHGGARHAVMARVMAGLPAHLAPIGHAIGPVIVRVPRPKPLRPFVSRFAPWRIKVTNLLPAAAARYGKHRGCCPLHMPALRRGRRHSAACTATGPASIERRVVLRRGIRRSTAALPLRIERGWRLV